MKLTRKKEIVVVAAKLFKEKDTVPFQ